VFIGISSPADLWDFCVPEGEPLLELRMHPSKLHLPVLRTVTRHGGISDRMLDDSPLDTISSVSVLTLVVRMEVIN